MFLLILIFVFELFFGGLVSHVSLPDIQANVFYGSEVARNSSVRFSKVQFGVEVARTATQRTRGLMFRKNLAQDQGMLFVFDDDAVRNFWMKNTLIPLDMIFVDKDGKVVSIQANALPCNEQVAKICPNYSSLVPARYVLEINAGLALSHAIRPGSRMDISIP